MEWWCRTKESNQSRKYRLKGVVLGLHLFVSFYLHAQDSIPRNWSLNGYVTNMQTFSFRQWSGNWINDNQVHNRLNFNWHTISNRWNASIELRNRFLTGESVKYIPGYANMVNADDGFFDLSNNLSAGKSYIFNSKIDRAYIDFTISKFQLRIGRQRINWGQCFVWNPNDLFNAYSFFDFDYVEKPGSDAVRMQYFTSNASTFEMAIKANSEEKITSAVLYRFNRWKYDIQFLAGIVDDRDYMVGTGWSGNILDASFRGEITYFQPKHNFIDTSGIWVISLGSEYTFSNSFALQAEVLYNQLKGSVISSFANYYNMNLSAKKLSFSEYSFMLQGSYPVTPLFNVSLSGMYYPKLRGFYVGPTFSYSLTDNIDFSIVAQSFSAEFIKDHKEYFHFVFLRLKWHF
jgi:hypothetical protein